jgi:hypothetical protein
MKDPDRLFSSDPDLARLHEVLDRDEAPHGAIERATARILAESASDNASGEGGAARPSPSSTPWIFVGLGAMVLVAGVLSWSPWRQPTATNPEPLVSARPVPAAPPLASVAADRGSAVGVVDARPAQLSIRVDDLPTASRPAAAPSAAGSADPFLEELALVERARSALARGRGRECLEATAGYERRFAKGGLFREEVEVMHIEALAMSGERAAARARGQRFLDVHRDTPYAERIRRVLDQAAE